MEIIPVVPRGWCQGVVRAIQIAKNTAANHPNEKITMLGMIVHNRYVVDACTELGITCLDDPNRTRLQMLEKIDSGIVIFTAHGVSDEVRRRAKEKGLLIADATCVDVQKTHKLIEEHSRNGYVLYIGRKKHPETEGISDISDHIFVIQDIDDLNSLPQDLSPVWITTQTTISALDCNDLMQACKNKYPDAVSDIEICNATLIRQKAVQNLKNIDVLIVVGDPCSNNSRQLLKIGLRSGIKKGFLLESASQLNKEMFADADRVAVTSGSSTPDRLTSDVIKTLQKYAETGILNICSELSGPVL